MKNKQCIMTCECTSIVSTMHNDNSSNKIIKLWILVDTGSLRNTTGIHLLTTDFEVLAQVSSYFLKKISKL